VICHGEEITALTGARLSRFLRSSVGFVFQFGNLLSYLTVFRNIALPLVLNGMDKTACEKRVFDLLERVGLRDAGAALPHELSGGELQRVAIARAIAHKPRLLLADEPTASLDSATAHQLIEMMFGLGKENRCTIVVTTHDQEILRLADQVVRLRDGKTER
jgi:ABC-type lipoprotein export system ATPase subunit